MIVKIEISLRIYNPGLECIFLSSQHFHPPPPPPYARTLFIQLQSRMKQFTVADLEGGSTPPPPSVQYKVLKLGSHSGHAKTNLSGHCVKMSGHYFLKVTPILKHMIW